MLSEDCRVLFKFIHHTVILHVYLSYTRQQSLQLSAPSKFFRDLLSIY